MHWHTFIHIQHDSIDVRRRGQRVIIICLVLIALCILLILGTVLGLGENWYTLLPILSSVTLIFGLIGSSAHKGFVNPAAFGLVILTWIIFICAVFAAQRVALTPFFFLLSILIAIATLPLRWIAPAIIASLGAIGLMAWLTRNVALLPPERGEVYLLSIILLMIVGSVGWAGTRLLVQALERADNTLAQSEQLALQLQQKNIDLQKSETQLDQLFRQFVAPNVANHILHDDIAPEIGGERRIITTLFVDIRQYSRLAETQTPEVVTAVINTYFSALGKIVSTYGGTITHFAGDQIMAIFNAPQDQPNHVHQAVLSACHMQEILPSLHETQLTCGIGITTGLAIVGYIGIDQRYEYTAIGDSINIAARLCDIAQAGEILIGEQTNQELLNIETTYQGTHLLKGKQTEIQVYSIVCPHDLT